MDTTFLQEYHEGFPVGEQAADNNVRSIAVDKNNTVWIATAAGVFKKNALENQWVPVITGTNRAGLFSNLRQQFRYLDGRLERRLPFGQQWH